MKTLLLLFLASSLTNAFGENGILEWNAAMLSTLKKDASAPLLVARSLAILHMAQREAVASEAQPEDANASASAAAHIVATSLQPNHKAIFDQVRDRLKTDAYPNAVSRGEEIGRRWLANHSDDGCSMHVSYVPKLEAGQWRRTPPFMRPPELPQWASKVRPFFLKQSDQLRPAGPPKMTTTEWATSLNEVKTLGAKERGARTSEQTEIARFWSDFSYTETPPGHWNSIARAIASDQSLSLRNCANLFALLNAALVDAGIACWDAKYHYNFWRPVTAVRRADEDENDATITDSEWLPMLNTPAHPEYPSGHSTFSGAAITIIAHVLKTSQITFTVRSDALPGVERRFHHLRDCALECGVSRVYGGIHYRFSCEDGLKLGEAVGQWIIANGETVSNE